MEDPRVRITYKVLPDGSIKRFCVASAGGLEVKHSCASEAVRRLRAALAATDEREGN